MAASAFDASFDYPVLFRERPYVYAVDKAFATVLCHYCLKSTKDTAVKAIRCSSCQFATYCNRECQTAAHGDHKDECGLLKKFKNVPSTTARLIARMFFKRAQSYSADERLPKELQKQRQPSDVTSHKPYLKDPTLMALFQDCWQELQKYVDAGLEEKEALNMHAKLNAHSSSIRIGLNGGTAICGTALYIGVSSLKYSCDPDVVGVNDGIDLVVHAVKPGVQNKNPMQLTLDYQCFQRALMTTGERRAHLAKLGFKCNCSLCRDLERDAEMHAILCQHCTEAVVPVLDDPLKKTAKCPSCSEQNDVTEANELMKDIGALLATTTLARFDTMKASNSAQFYQLVKEVKSLQERAVPLLSPVNAFGARLTDYGLVINSKDELACRRYLQSLAAYRLYGCSFHLEWAAKMLSLGMRNALDGRDETKNEDGIKLLKKASSVFQLHGHQRGVGRCRQMVAQASHEMEVMDELMLAMLVLLA